ncbi:DUF5343 domain-containing protein [Amycolatopsis sp. TRM77291]
MTSIRFIYSHAPGKLEEFIQKLQSVGTPEKITSEYPKSIGFGASHARGFPGILKYAGLLDSSGQPTEIYKKGIRGGQQGRALVGDAIQQAYKPLFEIYPNADRHSDSDLVTFVKSNSNLDEEKSKLVVRTFKALCKFGDFSTTSEPSNDEAGEDSDRVDEINSKWNDSRRRHSNNSGVVINVNISLSVDATSDSEVYDAFFAAMARHLKGLMDGDS